MTNKIGKKRKITFWTRLGFGMGGMLNSGALTFTHSYMVLFLSTECGLSAGEAALISSFAIYVNAILCPLMGFVADNFYATKIGRIFGRRRFWILLAIPMMIAEPLIFVATPFGFPYYFVLYLIYNVAYTFCTANLSPLTIEMTDDFKERTYLTGYKHLFGNAAGFLMAALVGFGFGTFGETNPFSYFIIATINASVMAISLLCVYLSTWEHTPRGGRSGEDRERRRGYQEVLHRRNLHLPQQVLPQGPVCTGLHEARCCLLVCLPVLLHRLLPADS